MEKINVCVWSFIGALPSTLLWATMQLASTPIAPVWAYGSEPGQGEDIDSLAQTAIHSPRA